MSIVNRLKQYMEYIGMPSTQFADVAKVSRPTISQILNGRNRKISNEIIAKIHEGFPSLNIMWLLFGDGDIELSQNIKTSEAKKPPILPNLQSYDINSQASADVQDEKDGQNISLRTSNIEEFVEENAKTTIDTTATPNPITQIQQMSAASSDAHRKIQSIMVFYNDSSFEIFTPSSSVG